MQETEEAQERIVQVTTNFTFDVSHYLSRRYSDPHDKERGVQPFFLQNFHNFYKQFHSEWDSSSARLLEFGGGPVVYPLISAAPRFNEITFADYLQISLDVVRGWRDIVPSAHNWRPYIEYVVHNLEGVPNGLGTSEAGQEYSEQVVEREADMRAKMKSFCKCNIRDENVLGYREESFNVVSSSLCIEVVSATLEEFRDGILKVAGLLKPGGFLVCLVSLQQTYWLSRGARHPHLYLEKEDVQSAFTSAGLKVIQNAYFVIPEVARHILNDCGTICFIAGQKPI